jgi:hypothetical protein
MVTQCYSFDRILVAVFGVKERSKDPPRSHEGHEEKPIAVGPGRSCRLSGEDQKIHHEATKDTKKSQLRLVQEGSWSPVDAIVSPVITPDTVASCNDP